MGNLPACRVQIQRPFFNTGVDCRGPFFIKQGNRSKISIKAYVVILICLVTKAVHIELVSDLTTEAFIATLRRFFARRGKSTNIYSDNATNFRGACNELKELNDFLKSESMQYRIGSEFAHEGLNWHFIPPRAAHFGGQ